jgi:hypothetical protein
MSEANKNQSKIKPVRTDAKSKVDPQTEKQVITNLKKNGAKPLKANDRQKDEKRTQING